MEDLKRKTELDKVNFTPKPDIDEYLDNNKFNAEIFYDLQDRFWGKQFKALEFFNLLYEQYAIICANKNKPLAVTHHVLNLGLSENQSLFFLPNLLALLSAGHNPDYGVYADSQLLLCHDFIKKHYDELDFKFYSKYENLPRSFNFESVSKHLKTLSTINEKRIFLNDILTDFQQNKHSLPVPDEDFAKKCELEIIRLEKLYILRAPQTTNSIIKVSESSSEIYPKCFKEIFTSPGWEKYINVFEKTQPALLSKDWEFIGNRRKHIGVICSWIKELQGTGIISQTISRSKLATVLNTELKQFNMGTDGKTFDNISKAYDNFKPQLITE